MADERDDNGGVVAAGPTDALKEAGQQLLGLLVQRATEAATQRVSGLADRLTDVTESGGDVRAALNGKARQNGQVEDADADEDDDDGDGDGDEKPGGLKGALVSLKDKMENAFGGGGGSGGAKKLKMTNIVEGLDVGLPLRTTYDTWTQFAEFPSFMKKVETVDQESDEKTNWKAKVFWSRRTWQATIIEQVPDSHIVWRSTGPKGHVDGAVSFTALGPEPHPRAAGAGVLAEGAVRADRKPVAGAGPPGPAGVQALPPPRHDQRAAAAGGDRGLARGDPRQRGRQDPRGGPRGGAGPAGGAGFPRTRPPRTRPPRKPARRRRPRRSQRTRPPRPMTRPMEDDEAVYDEDEPYEAEDEAEEDADQGDDEYADEADEYADGGRRRGGAGACTVRDEGDSAMSVMTQRSGGGGGGYVERRRGWRFEQPRRRRRAHPR